MVTAMILYVSQTTILAHSWRLQIKTYELNRVPKCRISIAFTSSNPAFDLDWWHFIDQLHGRFLTCILEYEQESEKVHTEFQKLRQEVKLQDMSIKESCKKWEPKTYLHRTPKYTLILSIWNNWGCSELPR